MTIEVEKIELLIVFAARYPKSSDRKERWPMASYASGPNGQAETIPARQLLMASVEGHRAWWLSIVHSKSNDELTKGQTSSEHYEIKQ